jgi:hypothetical protein
MVAKCTSHEFDRRVDAAWTDEWTEDSPVDNLEPNVADLGQQI